MHGDSNLKERNVRWDRCAGLVESSDLCFICPGSMAGSGDDFVEEEENIEKELCFIQFKYEGNMALMSIFYLANLLTRESQSIFCREKDIRLVVVCSEHAAAMKHNSIYYFSQII